MGVHKVANEKNLLRRMAAVAFIAVATGRESVLTLRYNNSQHVESVTVTDEFGITLEVHSVDSEPKLLLSPTINEAWYSSDLHCLKLIRIFLEDYLEESGHEVPIPVYHFEELISKILNNDYQTSTVTKYFDTIATVECREILEIFRSIAAQLD